MPTTTIYSGISIYVHVFPFFFFFFHLFLFFFVSGNISRDSIWIIRNWADLKYFACPDIDTTTEITMMVLKT